MGYPLFRCSIALALVFTWAISGNAQTIPDDGQPDLLVGTGAGRGLVRLLSGADGAELVSGFPWGPGATNGVRVAAGDVTGDGVADLFVATGPGDGRVSVFNGATAGPIVTFAPFGNHFRGGVHMATGDIDGDGQADLLVGGGRGSGRVRIYSSATYQQILTDFPFGIDYTGGVTVAAGDINGDGRVDVIVGQETGGLVRVFDGAGPGILASGTPYGPGFTGGIHVAAGDVDADGNAEIITGPREGGRTVFVINGQTMQPIAGFSPFGGGSGVSVAAGDLNGDGAADLVVGSGPGTTPRIRVFRGPDGLELMSGLVFEADFLGGVFVATTAGAGLRFTSDDETTFEAGVSGTFAVTTTGPVSPITMTGTLPSGVTFTDNGDGTAALDGTPAANSGGSYALTFIAAAGTASETTQAFTLTVNEAPAITSAAAITFPLGTSSSFTVETAGFPRPAITAGGAALPAGVTFTDNGDGTGTLSGTPAPGTGGSYAVAFTASNGIGADAVQAFTLTVEGSPVFTSAAATAFETGVAGSFAVEAIATPAVTAITAGGALPAGVTFADGGGGAATLSGTPAPGTGGIHALTFTATNGVHTPTVQDFTLTVNEAPAITSAATATFPLGAATTFTITTGGFPAPAVTLSGALPAGVTFADNGDGTATLTGTPTAGGSFALSITAANGIGANAVQSFTLTVNGAPAITSLATTTFVVGTPGTFTVTTVGFPAPSIAVTGTLPGGITFIDNGNGTGTLSGTPAAATGGAYALTFTAANGTPPDAVQAFTLTVAEAPSITSAASATFVAGTPGSFTVTTSGSPSPAIAVGGAALPSGVTFVDNGDGTGTLAGMAAAGTGGVYAVTFTATNTAGSSPAQAFTLTVNEAPQITSAASTSFVVGQPGTFTVTTTGVPAPVITLGGGLPAGVTFADHGDGTGTLSGTPTGGTAGVHSFTFTASNGVGASGVQSFTLNVNQAPAITSANSADFTVGTPGTFTVTTTGFPTPTVSQTGTLPTGVTFTPATNVIGGTATQTGAYPLVFTATNGVAPDGTQDFTLNVVCPAITVNPAVLPDGLFETAYGPVSFTQTGSTGSTFAWDATGLPDGLALSTDGVLSGTPTTTVVGAAVSVTVTDNFGCTGTRNTTITIRPVADNESYLNGVGHTQFVVGATAPATPHVFVSETVLNGDLGPGTLAASLATGPANGAVTMASNGAFVYTPNVNFAGPTDSFTYTLTDGNGVTNTGTVTIALANVVWYVNSAAGASGDGRSHSPFNTLASVGTPSISTHYIYVHTGVAATPGDLTLDPAQTLHGQGAAFALGALTLPEGTRPTLAGTVTLADNTVVRGVNFSGAATALSVPAGAYTGTVVIDQVNVTGGTTGLQVGAATGVAPAGLTMSNAQFTNLTGAEISMNGGNLPVTFPATTTISSNAGASITIQNRTGGTVTFAGPVNVTGGTGVALTTNTGSTIAFSGGLALSTGANAAFTATGGGTVQVCDEAACNPAATGGLVNTIVTTAGTALNVVNTTLGAAGLEFRSISVNGATNGIVLNNTGAVSGLKVAGNGGSCTSAATCSGGSIQSTTGVGILLTSTSHVRLTRVFLQGTGDDAIRGLGVNNLAIADSFLTNNGNATAENGLQLGEATGLVAGITGTLSLSNTTIRASAGNNVHIRNTSGTLASMTIAGSAFNDLNDVTGANSFLFEMSGTAVTTTASITGSTFSNNSPQRALEVQAHDAGVISAFTVSGSTFTENGIHASFTQDTAANLTFSMLNNAMTFANPLHAINVFSSATSTGGTLRGTIQGNTIGTSGVANSGARGNAIRAFIQGRTAATLLVDNNTIRQVWLAGSGARGIDLQFAGATATGQGITQSDVTVTNNDVDTQAPASSFGLAAIYLAADDQGSPARVRANITGNSARNSVGGGSYDYPTFDGTGAHLIFVDVGGAAEGQLVNSTGAANATAQLTNANAGTAAAQVFQQGIVLIAGPITTP